MTERHLLRGTLAVCVLLAAPLAENAAAYDCRRAQELVGEAKGLKDSPVDMERKLREADRLCPNYGEPQLLLGDLYKEQGDWSRAKQSYARAGVAAPVQDDRARERIVELRRVKTSASLKAESAAGIDQDGNFPKGTRVVRERVGGVEVIRPAIPDEAVGGAEEDAAPLRTETTVEGGVQVIRPFRPGVKPEGAAAPKAARVSASDLAAIRSLIDAGAPGAKAAPEAASQGRRIEVLVPRGYESEVVPEGEEPRVREVAGGGTQVASLAPDLASPPPAEAVPARPSLAAPGPAAAPAPEKAEDGCVRAEELYKEGVALSDGSVREEFAYQKAIEACPGHAESRNALGVVYVIQKKWGMAEAEFKKAVELRPSFAKAWFNLASLYEQSGEFTRAIDAFLAAVDADKTYTKSYPRLAGLYLRFGNAEAAIQHLERMLQVEDNAEARYQLAVLYWKKGDKRQAGDAMRAAVKANPELLNKPEAGEVLSQAF